MKKNAEYEVRTNGMPLWDNIPKDEQDSFILLLLETVQKITKPKKRTNNKNIRIKSKEPI